MIELTDDRRDGLVEILNIANGRAAASLSKTVGEPITIRVPTLQFAPLGRAERILIAATGDTVGGVSQEFTGPFDTRASLIFPREHCATLVRLWTGEDLPAEEIADLEEDTLAEIGNIVLYAAFSAIAKLLNGKFSGTLPVVRFGAPRTLLTEGSYGTEETLLLTFIDFGFAQRNFQGFLSLLLKPGALDKLMDCVDRFVREDTAL